MSEQYTIRILSSAQREIKKLPPKEIARIVPAIQKLAENPRPSGCKKLMGNNNHYRIRIGDYRVLYVIEDIIRIVEVAGVRHRREAYE
jgi:mRNA interferase RelE/StbE